MKTAVKKLYEAMFLIDSAQASDWDEVITVIKTIFEKAKAEVVSIRKWDERKLAYKINGKTRGTYILCYFRADGKRIRDIEKDVQLSERIMRVLILNAEQQTVQDIEGEPASQKDGEKGTPKDTSAIQEAAEKAEAKQVDN